MENVPPELIQIPFWGGHATVGPSGVREGKAGFAYRLAYDEITVLIAEREIPHKTFPSVMVRVPGAACLCPGATECYEKAARMIRDLIEWLLAVSTSISAFTQFISELSSDSIKSEIHVFT